MLIKKIPISLNKESSYLSSIRISEIRILLVNVLIKSFNAGKCGSQGPQ